MESMGDDIYCKQDTSESIPLCKLSKGLGEISNSQTDLHL